MPILTEYAVGEARVILALDEAPDGGLTLMQVFSSPSRHTVVMRLTRQERADLAGYLTMNPSGPPKV